MICNQILKTLCVSVCVSVSCLSVIEAGGQRHITTANLFMDCDHVSLGHSVTCLITKVCASRSFSIAVVHCLTGNYAEAIVIWNMPSCSPAGDTNLFAA